MSIVTLSNRSHHRRCIRPAASAAVVVHAHGGLAARSSAGSGGFAMQDTDAADNCLFGLSRQSAFP
jgi:hypothetical protein